MEVDFMTKTETEKRFKRRKNIEKTFVIWAVGFLLIAIILLIIGDTSISVQALAAIGITLMMYGWGLDLLHRFLKKRELRSYDTGSLAMIDTEP